MNNRRLGKVKIVGMILFILIININIDNLVVEFNRLVFF